jgi:hypothetical protein
MSILDNSDLQAETTDEDDENSTDDAEWQSISLPKVFQIVGAEMSGTIGKWKLALASIYNMIDQYKIPTPDQSTSTDCVSVNPVIPR